MYEEHDMNVLVVLVLIALAVNVVMICAFPVYTHMIARKKRKQEENEKGDKRDIDGFRL